MSRICCCWILLLLPVLSFCQRCPKSWTYVQSVQLPGFTDPHEECFKCFSGNGFEVCRRCWAMWGSGYCGVELEDWLVPVQTGFYWLDGVMGTGKPKGLRRAGEFCPKDWSWFKTINGIREVICIQCNDTAEDGECLLCSQPQTQGSCCQIVGGSADGRCVDTETGISFPSDGLNPTTTTTMTTTTAITTTTMPTTGGLADGRIGGTLGDSHDVGHRVSAVVGQYNDTAGYHTAGNHTAGYH